MPWCDTPAMAAHLAEISAAVDPGAHAVLMLDQAGWPTELPARELHLLLQMDDDEAGALQAATGSGPESVNVQRGPIFTSL